MKKTLYFLAAVAVPTLIACGRPSSSNFFQLDGVGDPNAPVVGNPLPGKYSGNLFLANWDVLNPSYTQSLFGQVLSSSFNINHAYFTREEMKGVGGWDPLTIAIPQPMRLGEFDQSKCYMDPEALPLFGGDPFVAADVGEDIELHFDTDTFDASRDSDEDVPPDDLILWFSDIQDGQTGEFILNYYDEDLEIEWEGGTLGDYYRVPPLGRFDTLHFPEKLNVTVNNDPLPDTMVPLDNQYQFEWDSESGPNPDLMGTLIVMTVYGPSNGGSTEKFDVAGDNPYFAKIARMVCLARDNAEEFTIFQSDLDQALVDQGLASPFTVDDLMAMAQESGKYDFSTEDVNGNQTLDTRGGNVQHPGPFVEDGNGNGIIDKTYGISVLVGRRSERDVKVNFGGGHDAQILVNGNDLYQTKMEAFSAVGQCGNGIDDDGDGDVDDADNQCSGTFDNSELN